MWWLLAPHQQSSNLIHTSICLTGFVSVRPSDVLASCSSSMQVHAPNWFRQCFAFILSIFRCVIGLQLWNLTEKSTSMLMLWTREFQNGIHTWACGLTVWFGILTCWIFTNARSTNDHIRDKLRGDQKELAKRIKTAVEYLNGKKIFRMVDPVQGLQHGSCLPEEEHPRKKRKEARKNTEWFQKEEWAKLKQDPDALSEIARLQCGEADWE